MKIDLNQNKNFSLKVEKGLTQWDRGQILVVEGLELPVSGAVEVHFSTKEVGGTAVTAIGDYKTGILTVEVPDQVFVNKAEDEFENYNLYAFIYTASEKSGQTVRKIIIPVMARPRPDDVLPPSNEPNPFGKLIEIANAAAGSATAAKTAANIAVENAAAAQNAAQQAQTKAEAVDQKIDETATNIMKICREKFASVFKEQLTGTAVQCDCVNKISHEIKVQLFSENIVGISQRRVVEKSGVQVIFNTDNTIEIIGTATDSVAINANLADVLIVKNNPVKECTITVWKNSGTISEKSGSRLECLSRTQGFNGTGVELKNEKSTASTTLDSVNLDMLNLKINKGTVFNNYKISFKLSEGLEEKEFTPYISNFSGINLRIFGSEGFARNHAVQADGTVKELLSIAPNMILKADAPGVVISAEFNVDAQKWVEKKIAEIVSGGGINSLNYLKNWIEKMMITCEKQGNPILINDSMDFPIVSLEVCGSTTQGKNPSPENPQPVVNSMWDRISCSGKNLFNINEPSNVFEACKKDGDFVKCNINNALFSQIRVFNLNSIIKKNMTLTFSTKGNGKGINRIGIYGKFSDGKTDICSKQDAKNKATITIPDTFISCEFIILRFNTDMAHRNTDTTSIYTDFQLEIENTATPYESYKGFTKVLSETIQLSEWDKIKKINDAWRKITKIKRIELDTLNWQKSETINNLFFASIADFDTAINKAYAPNFVYDFGNKTDGHFYIGKSINIHYKNSSLEEFVRFLRTTKQFVLYPSIDETYEILSQEAQNVLNKVATFYPNSVISTNEGITVDLEYFADAKKYTDRKNAELLERIEKLERRG